MSSGDRRRVMARALAALCVLAPAIAGATPPTHCRPDEMTYFSCSTGRKTVSLCGDAASGAITRLSYRYGRAGDVELEWSASGATGPRFQATVEPESPRAAIREVWFDRGDIRYLLHACQGGDCPYAGGLAVLRGERVLSNAKCRREAGALDFFSRELVEFGDGTASSRSHTPLLEIVDAANPIDKLYPMPASAFH